MLLSVSCLFLRKIKGESYPLRKETDCLNCGAMVQGRYCHVCGQENTEPKETFWHMVTHFFYDITHFDGSFFVTLKDLFSSPGFLSREYMRAQEKIPAPGKNVCFYFRCFLSCIFFCFLCF